MNNVSTFHPLFTCVKLAHLKNCDYICDIAIHNMNTRLKQFLLAENISQSQFADTIGVARASISHILSGRNKPGFEFFSSIARHYPTLNLSWLITGKGRMYGNSPAPDSFVAVTSAASAGRETASAGEISPREEENDLFSDVPSGISHSRAADYGSPAEAAENDGRAKTASGRSVRSGTAAEGVAELRTEQYASPEARRITKVVVFYDDNTYQELK